MAKKSYMDGTLEVAPDGSGAIYSEVRKYASHIRNPCERRRAWCWLSFKLSPLPVSGAQDGKSVWQGKAKQVTGPGAAPPARAAFVKRLAQMKQGTKKKDRDREGPDDDDEDDVVRYECNSWLAEVEQDLDPAAFR